MGDRFYNYKPDYKGQVTFFAMEVFEALLEKFADSIPPLMPQVQECRRNVFTRFLDLNSLIGEEFEIQNIRFQGTEECRPCGWMDRALIPGAERFLDGCGGLRARILTTGVLKLTELREAEIAGVRDETRSSE